MKLTKPEFLDLHPCSDGRKFAADCKFNFVEIWETCPRGDWLIWLLRNTKQIAKPQAVEIAIACAERVLPIYEKKNPADKRPRLAIEAAANYLKTPSEANRKAYAAAYAAYAAAYAAYAADAARATERKWQADKIRSLIPNPFTK